LEWLRTSGVNELKPMKISIKKLEKTARENSQCCQRIIRSLARQQEIEDRDFVLVQAHQK